MKKLRVLLPFVMIALLALVACGKSEGGGPTATATSGGGGGGGGGNTVVMGSVDFVTSSVSIKAGQPVIFHDPQRTGGYHILCLGTDMKCVANAQGPSELDTASGVTFNAGDADKSIVFPNPGTYTVTCIIHTNMDVTITVS